MSFVFSEKLVMLRDVFKKLLTETFCSRHNNVGSTIPGFQVLYAFAIIEIFHGSTW